MQKARIIRAPPRCCDRLSLPVAPPAPYNRQVTIDTPNARATFTPSLDNLRNLLIIRSIALLGQVGVLAYVLVVNRTTEDLIGLTVCLAAIALLTIGSLWRAQQPWPVTDAEFLAQLLVDITGWTALMYFTGGANNPFISYYIVPLVISAAVLPWRYTWLVAGASLLAYSLLLYYYRPFPLFTPHAHMGHGDAANVHILGMWFNFLFSAGLITYFVVRMAAILRQQEAHAIARREERLRNDQIMAVASLAAGTAHELGTPMATMTVLVDEMLADDELSKTQRDDCLLLRAQLEQCRSTLTTLTRTAETTSIDPPRVQALGQFVSETVTRWAVRRPGVIHSLTPVKKGDGPRIHVDSTLAQALENLLNNAADCGSPSVVAGWDWDTRLCYITVRDQGPGIPPEMLETMGKPIIRTSRKGLGIGLLLSHAAVERVGGHIELSNASGGGTLATLALPLPAQSTNHE